MIEKIIRIFHRVGYLYPQGTVAQVALGFSRTSIRLQPDCLRSLNLQLINFLKMALNFPRSFVSTLKLKISNK